MRSGEVAMQEKKKSTTSRMDIGIRLLYTILYILVFEIIKTIIHITVVFQYVFLLLTLRHNIAVRNFSNKVVTYGYDVMRYLTLNKNERPFPFSDFPAEMEEPVDVVTFGG
jgi:hypothetical protein